MPPKNGSTLSDDEQTEEQPQGGSAPAVATGPGMMPRTVASVRALATTVATQIFDSKIAELLQNYAEVISSLHQDQQSILALAQQLLNVDHERNAPDGPIRERLREFLVPATAVTQIQKDQQAHRTESRSAIAENANAIRELRKELMTLRMCLKVVLPDMPDEFKYPDYQPYFSDFLLPDGTISTGLQKQLEEYLPMIQYETKFKLDTCAICKCMDVDDDRLKLDISETNRYCLRCLDLGLTGVCSDECAIKMWNTHRERCRLHAAYLVGGTPMQVLYKDRLIDLETTCDVLQRKAEHATQIPIPVVTASSSSSSSASSSSSSDDGNVDVNPEDEFNYDPTVSTFGGQDMAGLGSAQRQELPSSQTVADYHANQAIIQPTTPLPSLPAPQPARPQRKFVYGNEEIVQDADVCRDWQVGKCGRAQCRFIHVNPGTQIVEGTKRPSMQAVVREVHRYNLRGQQLSQEHAAKRRKSRHR